MHIVELHFLALCEIPQLARARYMPHGWNREGNRIAERKGTDLRSMLDQVLATTPNRLLVRPTHVVLEQLLKTAAQERKLQDMVARMVTELQALPEIDQGDAHAAAELDDLIRGAMSLQDSTTAQIEAITKGDPMALRIGLTSGPIVNELLLFSKALAAKLEVLRGNRATLT